MSVSIGVDARQPRPQFVPDETRNQRVEVKEVGGVIEEKVQTLVEVEPRIACSGPTLAPLRS